MQIHQERFEAWLFSQPDGRTWDYMSSDNCIGCSFFKETAKCLPAFGGSFYQIWDGALFTGEKVYEAVIPEFLQALLLEARMRVAGSGGSIHQIKASALKSCYLKLNPSFKPEECLPVGQAKEVSNV